MDENHYESLYQSQEEKSVEPSAEQQQKQQPESDQQQQHQQQQQWQQRQKQQQQPPSPESEQENVTKLTIDDVLDEMKLNDRFTIVIWMCSVYLCLTLSYNFVMGYFAGINPPWMCVGGFNTSGLNTSGLNTRESELFCSKHMNETFSSDSEWYDERCRMKR